MVRSTGAISFETSSRQSGVAENVADSPAAGRRPDCTSAEDDLPDGSHVDDALPKHG